MSSPDISRVVIECDGAAVPAAFANLPGATRCRIMSQGNTRDLDLQIQDLYQTVLTQVSSRHADLVRLAAYVYRTDQMVSRGGDRDSHGSKWKRQLALCVPVTDPEFWNQDEVKQALSAALAFLTDDQWLFTFSRWNPPLQQIQLRVSARDLYQHPSVITLFSGGLDSLCALIEAIMQGERPVSVGHWSTPAHQARQTRLMSAVHQLNLGRPTPLQGVRILRRGDSPVDNSQRTRGFLFGCLGSAIAAEVGAARVHLADNGPISLNLPINEQLVGALASRATHPRFLERLNRFMSLVLEAPVAVSNPLQSRTRTETLDILKEVHAESLLPLTLSCSNWSRLPAATPQCGGCSQCVDRRFATIAAGLTHVDPAAGYQQDLFLEPLTPWERAMTALSYVRFARRVYSMTQTDLLTAFPQLLDLPIPDDPYPEATVYDAIDLVKRHAAIVLEVLEQQTVAHLPALIAGQVSAASLLSQVLAEQQGRRHLPPRAVEPRKRSAVVSDHQLTGASHPVVTPLTNNVFGWNGNGWQVVYGNEERVLSKSVGLTRLACLLREPHREFSPEQLELAVHGHVGDVPIHAFKPGELSFAPIASGEFKLDMTGVKLFEKTIAELEQDRLAAISVGDTEQARELEERRTELEQTLKASRGLGGRLRTEPTAAQKQYRAVYRSLHRTLEVIKPVHRPLYQHLKAALRIESQLCYAPEPPIIWEVQLPPPRA